MQRRPTRSSLRVLLGRIFLTEAELRALLVDHFPHWLRHCSTRASYYELINTIIEYVEPNEIFQVLENYYAERLDFALRAGPHEESEPNAEKNAQSFRPRIARQEYHRLSGAVYQALGGGLLVAATVALPNDRASATDSPPAQVSAVAPVPLAAGPPQPMAVGGALAAAEVAMIVPLACTETLPSPTGAKSWKLASPAERRQPRKASPPSPAPPQRGPGIEETGGLSGQSTASLPPHRLSVEETGGLSRMAAASPQARGPEPAYVPPPATNQTVLKSRVETALDRLMRVP